MKFSEMMYVRPDVEALGAFYEDAAAKLGNAETFAEAEEIFLSHEQRLAEVNTMFSLSYIRHSIDTNDAFYDAENDFADEAAPLLEEPEQHWKLAMLRSKFRPDFEAKYGGLFFTNAEIELKTFSPEIVPDLQRENALVSEYDKLVASAKIPFEGGVYTVSQLTPKKQAPEDGRRRAAWVAEGGWYLENGEELDHIYDELVRLRTEIAKKLGYENYVELGYYRMTRNCYTKEDIEAFRAAVVKYIVPLADGVYRRQAARLGKTYPMEHCDNILEYRSGNPAPQGRPEDILAQGKRFYHELSPETAAFIDVMLDNELMDVLSKDGKQVGGYCTDLLAYKVPFIFANFNGTAGDVEVITHEAGHAFAFYTARDTLPISCVSPTSEACEVHSMSMEFFAWPWLDGFFGEDARKFRYTHLSGALTFIPYGTMVDHFQHIVYENPDLTPEQRHEEWRKLSAVYMPWMKLDSIPFYGDGRHWQRQLHIYGRPFYYIDYCLAQSVALQFWAAIQADPKAAWEKYMVYTAPGGTKTFRDLVTGAGMMLPFSDAALKGVAEAASQWLENYDLTGIA
ncbi:MAG: M3 family oligoendopeptidase [Firmicutes bacterium]|nr:M3 family oligoendopeptidase [Bacillota bacterium]